MNKEKIYRFATFIGFVIVLIAISILIWWATIHSIDQHLDTAVRMIPKEAVGVAGAVEAQFMLVRQDIWFLFFFGVVGWGLLLWREIKK